MLTAHRKLPSRLGKSFYLTLGRAIKEEQDMTDDQTEAMAWTHAIALWSGISDKLWQEWVSK